MAENATIEGVLSVIAPGETLTYPELLERMTRAELARAGVGIILDAFAWRGGPTYGDIVVWREPDWDDEHTGGWDRGLMKIRRRPAHEDDE